jgi:hypothetical protein
MEEDTSGSDSILFVFHLTQVDACGLFGTEDAEECSIGIQTSQIHPERAVVMNTDPGDAHADSHEGIARSKRDDRHCSL